MPTVNSEIKSKLQKFESTIMEEVAQRCREINSELAAYRESELEKYKDSVLNESYNLIHKKTGEISADATKEISNKRSEVKRRLYSKRDEYTKLVFSDARMLLLDFTAGDDYLPFLLEKARNIGKAYGGEGFELLLRDSDMKYAAEIQKAFGYACEAQTTQQIVLGGILAKNKAKGYVIDESLDTILEAQHEWFRGQPYFVVNL